MRQVFDLIIQAAPSRTTILINGESGTGKELVARSLHQNSARSDRAFITVNSGNLPPDLLESNLFGHVKGAFTGAVYPKKGLFELADKGTIFFDEIGNIPLETQAKLLRVIQEREFMRLGGVENIKVDVRIIAATNVDLQKMMEEGKFREDLYYRLHVITVQLPPLRERKDDIPLLVQHFIEKYGEENSKPGLELTAEALDLLIDYDWPGNVRELENVIERADGADLGTAHRRRHGPRERAQQPPLPDAAVRGAARGHLLPRRRGVVPARPDRIGARGGRRRAEARRGAAAHQADDAQRDDQAPRHPAAAQEGPAARDRRARPAARSGRRRRPLARHSLNRSSSARPASSAMRSSAPRSATAYRHRRRRQPPPARAREPEARRRRSSATSPTSSRWRRSWRAPAW